MEEQIITQRQDLAVVVDKIAFLTYSIEGDRVAETREACDRRDSCGNPSSHQTKFKTLLTKAHISAIMSIG